MANYFMAHLEETLLRKILMDLFHLFKLYLRFINDWYAIFEKK